MKKIELNKFFKKFEENIPKAFSFWFQDKYNIIEMKYLENEIRDYSITKIVKLTNHDEFDLNDAYFYFENKNKIVSLTDQELEKRIDEQMTDEDIKEFEEDLMEIFEELE